MDASTPWIFRIMWLQFSSTSVGDSSLLFSFMLFAHHFLNFSQSLIFLVVAVCVMFAFLIEIRIGLWSDDSSANDSIVMGVVMFFVMAMSRMSGGAFGPKKVSDGGAMTAA